MKRILPAVVFLALALSTVTVSAALLPPITPENADTLAVQAEIPWQSLRKAVFAPDGESFATGSGNDADFDITLWNTRGGAYLRSFTGLTGIVWDLAFSPDGTTLASAANDANQQTLRIWNSADGSLLAAPASLSSSSSLAFSPDGSRLAVGGLTGWPNGAIWIYDTRTWAVTAQWKAANQNVTALVYTPDGTRLVSAGTDGLIRVWSVADGKELKVLIAGKQANRLAISADGRLLASSYCAATDPNGCIKGGVAVWTTNDWKVVKKFADIAESMAFTSDSRLLITGSGQNDPQMRFRQADDWALVHTIPGDTRSVALSPDNRRLVSLQWDKIFLWGVPQK